MSPLDDKDVEARLSTELRDIASSVDASADGRARIDRRIRRRANRRRVMAVAAVVVVVGLAAGVLGRRGTEPVKVTTQPQSIGGALPLLAPSEAPWWIGLFVTDRYDLTIQTGDQQLYTLTVQTVGPNLPDPVSELGPGEIWRSVGGEDAIVDVYGPSPSIRWQPTASTLASLSTIAVDDQGRMSLGASRPDDGRETPSTALTSGTSTTEPAVTSSTEETALDPDQETMAGQLVDLANSMVPVDDETWWNALTPELGDPPPPNGLSSTPPVRLGLPAKMGTSHFTQYSPWERIETTLDVNGFAAGTFVLATSNTPTSGGGQGIELRGTHGIVVDAQNSQGEPMGPAIGAYTHKLLWDEAHSTIELAYTPAATQADAVMVATALRVLDDAEWRAVLLQTQASSPDDTPTTTAPTPKYDGPGTDHPFVGRTEREIADTYPFVRVIWIDGSYLATKADLRSGRVDLAVSEGIVVAATVEGCFGTEPRPGAEACTPSPDDGPDATGTLGSTPDGFVLHADAGPSAPYDGVSLRKLDILNTRDTGGRAVSPDELRDGRSVRVWFSGPCAQTSTPQCDVQAMVVEE